MRCFEYISSQIILKNSVYFLSYFGVEVVEQVSVYLLPSGDSVRFVVCICTHGQMRHEQIEHVGREVLHILHPILNNIESLQIVVNIPNVLTDLIKTTKLQVNTA